jgi:hypothetical protein
MKCLPDAIGDEQEVNDGRTADGIYGTRGSRGSREVREAAVNDDVEAPAQSAAKGSSSRPDIAPHEREYSDGDRHDLPRVGHRGHGSHGHGPSIPAPLGPQVAHKY